MWRRTRARMPMPTREATSTAWVGYTGPDPSRPADYGPGASYRRPDRYVGTGQPRQQPDPQRVQGTEVAMQQRPLTQASPAGGRLVGVWDHRAPDPVGAAQVRAITALYGAGQAGQLGEIRWGAGGRPRDSVYLGELGPLQLMHGAQLVAQDARRVGVPGARSTVRGGMGTGIPSQTGLPSYPLSPAQAVLAEMAGW